MDKGLTCLISTKNLLTDNVYKSLLARKLLLSVISLLEKK